MSKKRKPFIRWIGEAALIFLSIMAAFYVENYRERKARETTYLKHLEDFRYDLRANVASMNFELESKAELDRRSGYLRQSFVTIDSLEVLVSNGDSKQLPAILKILGTLDNRLAQWIFASSHYERLTLDYYYYIRNAALKSKIGTHKQDNLHRHDAKKELNELLGRLHDLQIDLNFDNPTDRVNRDLIFNNRMLNLIRKIKDEYRILVQTTELTIQRDAVILEEIDREFGMW